MACFVKPLSMAHDDNNCYLIALTEITLKLYFNSLSSLFCGWKKLDQQASSARSTVQMSLKRSLSLAFMNILTSFQTLKTISIPELIVQTPFSLLNHSQDTLRDFNFAPN